MKQIVNKPSPITGGMMELCTETASVEYRGETISYEKSFYHCLDSDLEFADEDLEAANLKRIYDTYRHFHAIPSAEDLKAVRERYGIPSSAMSLILGLGENQFGLYEEGTVPALSVGKLLSFAMEPENMREMLRSARSLFSEKLFDKYYRAFESSLHPATYEIEENSLMDYEVFTGRFPNAVTINTSRRPSYAKKDSYNGYAYANAC